MGRVFRRRANIRAAIPTVLKGIAPNSLGAAAALFHGHLSFSGRG
jgi:hypothetical protein